MLSSNSKSIDWSDLAAFQKKARGIDDYDLGEVQKISPNYIVTQKGTIIGKRFYIPKYLVEGYDRDVVSFKVTKDNAENKLRDLPPPADEYSKYKTPEVSTDIETRIPVLAEKLEVSKTKSTTEATVIKEPLIVRKIVEYVISIAFLFACIAHNNMYIDYRLQSTG